jgi:hypothetical protein
VSDLLHAALGAVDPGPGYWRSLTTVANLLRESGDPEVEALLGPPLSDREAWERLCAFADGLEGGGLLALDLKTAYLNPNAYDGLASPRQWVDDDAA